MPKIKGHEYIIGNMKSLETPDWIRVARLSEIPSEGLGHPVKADGLGIAIFRHDDQLYAIEDMCPHLGFPLSEGVMQDGVVTCGWHGWHIRLKDGVCGREKVGTKVFPCEVRDGDVYVKLY